MYIIDVHVIYKIKKFVGEGEEMSDKWWLIPHCI